MNYNLINIDFYYILEASDNIFLFFEGVFDMKKKLSLLFIFAIFASTLSAVIDRIDKETLDKIKDGLIEFHKQTYSSGNGKPDVSLLKKDLPFILVAKMDSFGLDRYFSFQTNEDVDQLVKAVQQGGGMSLSWYWYRLDEPYKYDLLKIMSYEESIGQKNKDNE